MVGVELRGVSFTPYGLGFLLEAVLDTLAEDTLDEGLDAAGSDFAAGDGEANASSARASTTRIDSAASVLVMVSSNSNFWPRSWSREKSSSDGKRAASSSAAARRTWTSCESSAAKGSDEVPLMGETLGLAVEGCWVGAVGLPRLIGVISGSCCTCLTGDTFCRPTVGGEVTWSSGGVLQAWTCVRPV